METNETKCRKTVKRLNKTKGCFFEKINKTDTPLAELSKTEKMQQTKIRNGNEAIITNLTEKRL